MMRYKKQGSVIVMLVLFCGLILCFYLPANARQNVKMSRKKVVLTTGKSKKLKLDGVKKKKKIRWKSSDKKVVSVSKNGKIKAKKNGSAIVTARYQKKKYKCKVLVIPKAAKQEQKEITSGTSYYRGFLVDNVYHSGKNGDIHYNAYFPDSYDGKKDMALYITLPGYQGLYFQGVAENIKTEDFGFEAQKYNSDMIILAPQLDDWGETSADQTIALVEYFLSHYPIDASKVYINGYSGGGETLSLVLGKKPELFARALMCSSQWDGEYEPVVKARTPVYFVIGEGDEYYSAKPFRDAYRKLHDLYRKQGLCERQIEKLLVLDVKDSSYFQGTGITYQHGGEYLFCRDREIMGWLFGK